ncbi:MAG: hypothetical protein R3B70_27790 [Polyangiaceae bacterium]
MAPSRKQALFGCAALLALVAMASALPACAEQGTTPTCEDNITEDGMQADVDDACNPFGVCKKDPANPEKCCVDDNGDPLTGARFDACMYGFGAYEPPENP